MTDTSKIYLFLASQGDWITKADANGDGAITKREFNDYIQEDWTKSLNWNGEQSPSAAEINAFWSKFDSNKKGSIGGIRVDNANALDTNEIEQLDNKLEVAKAVNEYLSTFTKDLGSVSVNMRSLRSMVGAHIWAVVQNTDKTGVELKDLIESEGALSVRKSVANLLGQEIIKQFDDGNGADKSKYQDELQRLLNGYITTIDASSDLGSMKSDLYKIFDAYSKTADQSYNLSNKEIETLKNVGFAYDKNSINDMQRAILEANVINLLQGDKEAINYYKEKIDDVIDEALSKGNNYYNLDDKTIKSLNSFSALQEAVNYGTPAKNEDDIAGTFGEAYYNALADGASNYSTEVYKAALNGGCTKENVLLGLWNNLSNINEVPSAFFNTGSVKEFVVNILKYYNENIKGNTSGNSQPLYTVALAACNSLIEINPYNENVINNLLATNDYKSTLYSLALNGKFDGIAEFLKSLSGAKTYDAAQTPEPATGTTGGSGSTDSAGSTVSVMTKDEALDSLEENTKANGYSLKECNVTIPSLIAEDDTASGCISAKVKDENGEYVNVNYKLISDDSDITKLIKGFNESTGAIKLKGAVPGSYSFKIAVCVGNVKVEEKEINVVVVDSVTYDNNDILNYTKNIKKMDRTQDIENKDSGDKCGSYKDTVSCLINKLNCVPKRDDFDALGNDATSYDIAMYESNRFIGFFIDDMVTYFKGIEPYKSYGSALDDAANILKGWYSALLGQTEGINASLTLHKNAKKEDMFTHISTTYNYTDLYGKEQSVTGYVAANGNNSVGNIDSFADIKKCTSGKDCGLYIGFESGQEIGTRDNKGKDDDYSDIYVYIDWTKVVENFLDLLSGKNL